MVLRGQKMVYPTRGQASVEVVMSFLMFILMIGVILSLSLYVYVNQVLLTAAKEGAREASVDPNMANTATQSVGVTNAQTQVQNFLAATAPALKLTATQIVVTPPQGTNIGNRTVVVTLNYPFTSPVRVNGLISEMNGGSGTGKDTYNISSTVTLRYEE